MQPFQIGFFHEVIFIWSSSVSFPGLESHLFLSLNNIHWLMGCTSLFIYSPIEEHLGCLQVLAIMNKAAINIHVQFLYGYKFSAPLGKYQEA